MRTKHLSITIRIQKRRVRSISIAFREIIIFNEKYTVI